MIPIPARKLPPRVLDQVPPTRSPGAPPQAQVAAALATVRARGARTRTINARTGPVMPNIASKT
jgi:hypothetical protein